MSNPLQESGEGTSLPTGRVPDWWLHAGFTTEAGEGVQGQETIVPIIIVGSNPRELTCIGTGFFIAASGILATAAHVFAGVEDLEAQGKGIVTLCFAPPNRLMLCPIQQVTLHTRADVAIAAVQMREDSTPLRNRCLPLTKETPAVGSVVFTWAYPLAITSVRGTQATLPIDPVLYRGRIRCEYREGRDAGMLPGPCYETDLAFENGASGGPVFDEQGRVFAVNSTGIGGTDIAYVSHIQSIGGLPVKLYKTKDGVVHEQIRISRLMEMGHVIVR